MFTMAVSRVGGAGGLNCQWSSAWPGATAQRPTWATRKWPPQPSVQLLSAPEAKANEPGSTVTPRKMQERERVHKWISRVAAKVGTSDVTVEVKTQLVQMVETWTFCSNW